jgi:hypothetical protein
MVEQEFFTTSLTAENPNLRAEVREGREGGLVGWLVGWWVGG